MQFDRFSLRQFSVGRLLEAISRRVTDLPHMVAWSSWSGTAEQARKDLRQFRGLHRGERCFILANGPSLAQVNHARLRHEKTFGLNRIYLLADVMGYLPDYYVCVNELVLDQFHNEIAQLAMPKFVNWNRRQLFNGVAQNLYFLRLRLNLRDCFSSSIEAPISSGGTVTFVALQIAFYMGFDQVIIVGLDHSYKSKGIPNRSVIRAEPQDEDHFHPQYFPKGSAWQPPDLLRSQLAYQLARDAYSQAGRTIVDATLGGKCEVFEKTDLEAVFDSVWGGAQ